MKKTGVLLLLAAAAPALAAPAPVQISAVKKTGSKQKSGNPAAIGGGTAERGGKSVFYAFTLRSTSPKVAAVKAKWVILVEGKLGVVRVGARGDQSLELPLGRKVSFDTAGADLRSVEWKGVEGFGVKNRRGKLEDEIKGYALRLFDPSGKMVAEKFSSKAIAEKAEEYFAPAASLRDRFRKKPGGKPALPSPFE